MRWALLLVVVSLSGCNRPKWDTPDDAYRSFAGALRRSELAVAYGALSSDSRKAIEARNKEVAAASGSIVKDDAALAPIMTFSSGFKPAPLGEVKIVSQSGTQAVLEVTAGGVTSPQKMTKEGDRWMVDLAELYKK